MARILIIDDEPQVRALLLRALERAGHQPSVAKDGKEGVHLYREDPFDLIITDLVMPEKEGLTVIMELKRDYPDLKVIVMSGGGLYGGGGEYLHMAKLLGAHRTFAKPVELDKLLGACNELLAEK